MCAILPCWTARANQTFTAGPCYVRAVVRPRWHDAVIALWIAALAAVGVAAIWGDDISDWFEDEEPAHTAPDPAGSTRLRGGGLS